MDMRPSAASPAYQGARQMGMMPPPQQMQVKDFHPSSQRQSKSSSELSEEKK